MEGVNLNHLAEKISKDIKHTYKLIKERKTTSRHEAEGAQEESTEKVRKESYNSLANKTVIEDNSNMRKNQNCQNKG